MCQPGRPGAAMPAGDGQAGSPGFDGFHSTKSLRVSLVGRDFDAGAGDHLVERPLRQLPVIRHRRHGKQHVVFGDIGVAGCDQPLDQRAHFGDVLGGARLDARRQAAERGDVLVELLVGLFGDLTDRLVERQAGIFLRRARVDLVVDVGDVADVSDLVGAVEMAQEPEQHVEHDHRPRIADMGEVIDRRPAHIHAHVRRIERRENPLLARERIVEFQFHRRIEPAK